MLYEMTHGNAVHHASGWGITWRECRGDILRGFFEECLGKHKKKCTGQYLGESFRKYLGGCFGETPLEYLAFSSQENICARVSFFNKVAGLRPSYDTSVSL